MPEAILLAISFADIEYALTAADKAEIAPGLFIF
jgi:hypothetical protein